MAVEHMRYTSMMSLIISFCCVELRWKNSSENAWRNPRPRNSVRILLKLLANASNPYSGGDKIFMVIGAVKIDMPRNSNELNE